MGEGSSSLGADPGRWDTTDLHDDLVWLFYVIFLVKSGVFCSEILGELSTHYSHHWGFKGHH